MCDCIKSYHRTLKKKACEVAGSMHKISEPSLLQTIRKEELEHYQKNQKSERIASGDQNFDVQDSKK